MYRQVDTSKLAYTGLLMMLRILLVAEPPPSFFSMVSSPLFALTPAAYYCEVSWLTNDWMSHGQISWIFICRMFGGVVRHNRQRAQ